MQLLLKIALNLSNLPERLFINAVNKNLNSPYTMNFFTFTRCTFAIANEMI